MCIRDSANGDILTSLHVVAASSDIQVTFADGTKSSATITTSQPQNDIAVLHADQLPAQIVPAVMGNPNAMRVGDEAYVVGNPFGLYSSMSAVSYTHLRAHETRHDLVCRLLL